MTRRYQKAFVNELTRSIAEDVRKLIDREDVPLSWDGHELRCLIADIARNAAAHTVIRLAPHGKRARDFRNHCATKL